MSSQHLGGDAVPANLVGGGAGRHRAVPDHHRHICHRVCHHHALYERHLHEWRGERR